VLPQERASLFIFMDDRRNIRLLIAYDGTDFSGWQKQETRRGRTVQGVIEEALEKLHKEPVQLTGSGRTDSGVHAAGQVANFYTGIHRIKPERFVPALNGLLPRDVRVLEARETRPDFHSRFDARMRTYRYHFICGRSALPWEGRYNMQIWRYPRVDRLNAYCRLLLGETDCSIFAAAGDRSKSRGRHISGASFFVQGDRLIFEISANAFLWKMARCVAGTFLRCEECGVSPEKLRDIIAGADRGLAGPVLPPQGLFLWKIDYYRN
jgi:tRNA pseudouridine38-40 synthase